MPNNFPKIDGLLSSTVSSATSTDSFQETFKKTNVKMMTNAETFKTVSKGIGRYLYSGYWALPAGVIGRADQWRGCCGQ